MIGAMVGAAIAITVGVTNNVPHGAGSRGTRCCRQRHHVLRVGTHRFAHYGVYDYLLERACPAETYKIKSLETNQLRGRLR